MNYSFKGNNQKIFNENSLMDFKTKQIKDFMNLNYGIRSRREHFGMESVVSDENDNNENNYEDENNNDNENNYEDENDYTYLAENENEDENIEDKPYGVYNNLEKMMKLNGTYNQDNSMGTNSFQSSSVRMKY